MDADSGQGRTDTRTSDMPAWVSWFTDGGRPVVAVIVMVMCAPGEHHLAAMAGWADWLAWGMPGCLVIYTGIAAVVATKRGKGTPGKRTAVVGAILSLLLAMSAQPISHLFVTGIWHGDPWPLVVVVSCIPPMVLGHLLHLAAGGSVRRTAADNAGQPGELAGQDRTTPDNAESPRTDADTLSWRILPDADASGQADIWVRDTEADTRTLADPLRSGHPQWIKDTAAAAGLDLADAADRQRLADIYAGQPPTDAMSVSFGQADDADTLSAPPVRVRPIASGHLSAFITGHLADNPDATDADIRSAARSAFPDTKPDTIRKAVNRVRDAQRAA